MQRGCNQRKDEGSPKSGSRVNTLSARFRHYNIKLLLFSTQVFRYVSNIVRQNTTNLIVGSPFPNRKELHKVAEEFGATTARGNVGSLRSQDIP